MSKKIYDPRLVWPYSLLLCGPTGCGKTTWIVELLKHHEELYSHTLKKLIWIYGVEQPDLFETIRKIWFPHQCEFISGFPKKLIWIYGVEQPDLFETIRKIWFPRQSEFIYGFPEDLLPRLEQTSDRGSMCIFDDVMNEVSSNSMVSKLFTRGKSHLGCSLVLMLQNVFPKGTQSRTISINAQYQVLFRNPRDSLQVSIFARQLYPHNSKDFLEIYKRATQRPYGYLFCCFTQSCPDEIRYRTNIFPNEYPSIVYQL